MKKIYILVVLLCCSLISCSKLPHYEESSSEPTSLETDESNMNDLLGPTGEDDSYIPERYLCYNERLYVSDRNADVVQSPADAEEYLTEHQYLYIGNVNKRDTHTIPKEDFAATQLFEGSRLFYNHKTASIIAVRESKKTWTFEFYSVYNSDEN